MVAKEFVPLDAMVLNPRVAADDSPRVSKITSVNIYM
jgi:hypothetical protein